MPIRVAPKAFRPGTYLRCSSCGRLLKIEWATRTVAQGEILDAFAAYCRDELDDVDPRECTISTVPARFARLGDPHAGIDDAPFSLEPLLEWAARDA